MAKTKKEMYKLYLRPTRGLEIRASRIVNVEIYEKVLKVAEETGDTKTALLIVQGRGETPAMTT